MSDFCFDYRDKGTLFNLKMLWQHNFCVCCIWIPQDHLCGLFNAVFYLHTLTCFEPRPPWKLLFLQVQDRPRKTSVPPHPGTFPLGTKHTFPDLRRSASQHCSSLIDRMTPGQIHIYFCNNLRVVRLTQIKLQKCFYKLPNLWLYISERVIVLSWCCGDFSKCIYYSLKKDAVKVV